VSIDSTADRSLGVVAFDLGITTSRARAVGRLTMSVITPAEFAHGRDLLTSKLEEVQPAIVIFTFKKTANSTMTALKHRLRRAPGG
jgi:hypothetical protein